MAESFDRPRIIITGLGLITPLGFSAWQTFRNLLAGRTLADRTTALADDVNAVDLVCTLGCISNVQHAAVDPAVDLAEQAARQAMATADVKSDEITCILGASKGAIHALTRAYRRRAACELTDKINHEASLPDAPLCVALGPHGYLTHHLRRRLRLGRVQNVVAACASSLTALHEARQAMLNDPDLGSVLVATCEASLLPMFIHSYRRLGVLPPLTRDGYRGRPLDRGRCGFMLAEQAAAVLLERVARPQVGQIELLDTAIKCEAYDLVRPAPRMAALACVAKQLMGRRHIDLLHPHATGTVEHDPRELAVYDQILSKSQGGHWPDLYACKGALGHGLGAGGLVAFVIACLCARTGQRPPMTWLENPIEAARQVKPTRHFVPLRTQVVFASGFGGHVAGAVLRKVGPNEKPA